MPLDNTDKNGPDDPAACDAGTYALILKVSPSEITRHVGALGRIEFAPGFYCYVGSALNGLERRLSRHMRRTGKRNHWHIDYFRSGASVITALQWQIPRRMECELSKRISEIAPDKCIGFGCSDCRCDSHLYWFNHNPIPQLQSIELHGINPSRFSP